MDKLHITATLCSPLVISDGTMTLDGILGAVLFEALQDVDLAHKAIPIRCESGLFHASSAMGTSIDAGQITFVAGFQNEHWQNPDLLLKNKKGEIHRKFDSTLGNVMNTYRQVTVPELHWVVDGDADKIRALLDQVQFIGKRRASGCGQVTRWDIEQSDDDALVGYLGEPLRPIPVELFTGDKSLPVSDSAWRPAYWDLSNRAPCYSPRTL